ncbi:MAG: inositol monophosphatase family protein [Planctomycetota bacterium]
MDCEEAVAKAIEAANAAGEILRDMLDRADVWEKSTNDLVTEADLAAQQVIESILMNQFPEYGFLGEESSSPIGPSSSTWQWVVDPLDGTTNYAHGLRSFCVSIALMHHRKPVVGVILDPMSDELFYAIAGRGAFLANARSPGPSERRLAPSSCQFLRKALVAVSFPPQLHRQSPEIGHFLEILLHSQSVRRLGSAALNLCYVAAGRLDAYFGSKLRVWDTAAAALIAEQAGVYLAGHDGGVYDPWGGQVVAAASEPLLREMLERLGSQP